MQRPLEDFIRALRAAEVRVSVAETMEAHEVVAMIGYANRDLLKDSLSITLAKTVGEKERFSNSFDMFFSRSEFTGAEDEMPSSEHGNGNDLADMMLADDREGLAAAMETAARDVGVSDIRFSTQVNFLTRRVLDRMGLADMERLIAQANRGEILGGSAMVDTLEGARSRLFGQARNYVERQFELYGQFSSEQLRTDFLKRTPLAAVDRRDFERMNQLIRRMARKLASRYMHRHKRTRRGHLDIRKTLRHNMVHDGIPFDIFWKQKKIEKPKIVAICDVSRSVASVARFLLMFLYNLNEIVSDIRSFAFSSYLIEVAEDLDADHVDDAIPVVLEKIGFMPTDYGRALEGLKSEFGDAIDRRTTVIILGDARSNYGEARADVMKWINTRARRVVWLNPEPKTFWGTGDSEMLRYRPYCHVAKTCRTIEHLERVVDNILRSTTRT